MFLRKLFKPRPLTPTATKDKYAKNPWYGNIWEAYYYDYSDYQVLKNRDGFGMISKINLNDGNNHYALGDYRDSFPALGLTKIHRHLDSMRTKAGTTFIPWELYASLGHKINHTCSVCKDTEVMPECQECDEGANLCQNCGGEGGYGCEECDGDGHVECWDCNGEGEIDCYECDGIGEVDCEECDGEGETESDCSDCLGEKVIKDSSGNVDDCATCEGAGTVNSKCENCIGGGKMECGDCNGGGKHTCDECGGDGYTYCDNCNGGWVECSDCYGDGNITCPICSGAAAGGECNNYTIPHALNDDWKSDDIRRLQSHDKFWRTEEGASLAVNYFKQNVLKTDLNNRKKFIQEKVSYLWDECVKGLSSYDKNAGGHLVKWDRDKAFKILEDNKWDENDMSSEILTYHLPFYLRGYRLSKLNLDKNEFLSRLKARFKFETLPKLLYPSPKKEYIHTEVSERLINYLQSPMWDDYFKTINLKCKPLPYAGKLNILDYNPPKLSWIHVVGPTNYGRNTNGYIYPNVSSFSMAFEGVKGALQGYHHKLVSPELLDKLVKNNFQGLGNRSSMQKIHLGYLLHQHLGDDFIGFWRINKIIQGAAKSNIYKGGKITNDTFQKNQMEGVYGFHSYIIVVKSQANIETMKNVARLSRLLTQRDILYCRETQKLYTNRLKPTESKHIVAGFPDFPWINAQDALVYETNLRFTEYPFMNWTINKPQLNLDDKKS